MASNIGPLVEQLPGRGPTPGSLVQRYLVVGALGPMLTPRSSSSRTIASPPLEAAIGGGV